MKFFYKIKKKYILLHISASSDRRETKHSLLDSSQYDESNGGSFIFLGAIDAELCDKM